MRRLRRWLPGSSGRRDAGPRPGQGDRAHSPLIGNALKREGGMRCGSTRKGEECQDARLILQIPGGEAQLAEGSVLRPREALERTPSTERWYFPSDPGMEVLESGGVTLTGRGGPAWAGLRSPLQSRDASGKGVLQSRTEERSLSHLTRAAGG